jgi:hypothetical protein
MRTLTAAGRAIPSFFALAGYIATAEAWIEFSKERQRRLDCADVPYFKMNEWSSRPEIAGWLYRVSATNCEAEFPLSNSIPQVRVPSRFLRQDKMNRLVKS